MIVVAVLGPDSLKVIHFSSNGFREKAVIKIEVYHVDPCYSEVYRVDYVSIESYGGKDAVERASARLGETGYDLFFNNCETFCTWVKVNTNSSAQVDNGVRAVMAFGSIVAFGLGLYSAF